MVDDDIAERFKNFDQDQKVSIISQIYDYLVEGQLIFNKKLWPLLSILAGRVCGATARQPDGAVRPVRGVGHRQDPPHRQVP